MRDPRLPIATAAIVLLGLIAMPTPSAAQYDSRYYDNRYYDSRYYDNGYYNNQGNGEDRFSAEPQAPSYAQQYPPPRDRPQPFDYRYRPQNPYWQNEPGTELYYGEATRQLNLEQLDPGW
jgi:hypothetical protein